MQQTLQIGHALQLMALQLGGGAMFILMLHKMALFVYVQTALATTAGLLVANSHDDTMATLCGVAKLMIHAFIVFFFCFLPSIGSSAADFHHQVAPPLFWEESCPTNPTEYGLCWKKFAELLPSAKKNIIIAILDSGINYQLPEISPYILINEAELHGHQDEDEDSNGFAHDVFGWNFVTDENGLTIDSLLPEYVRSKLLIATNPQYTSDFTQRVEHEFVLQKKYFEFVLSTSNEPNLQNQFQKLFIQPKPDPTISHGNNDVRGNLDNHGTMMASIMTRLLAQLPVSYRQSIKILPVRVLPAEGDERDEDLAAAIKYATLRGANIISMSFGKNLSPKESLVQEAISIAQTKGVLFIHSSGNEGKNIDLHPQYPRPLHSNSNWIQVGASSFQINEHFIQMYSNFGFNNVDIFSPGESILGTKSDGKLVPNYGTSAATAIVAITAAALWSSSKCENAKTVRQFIQTGSSRFPALDVFPPTPIMQPLARTKVNFCTLSQTCGVLSPLAALRKSFEESSCQNP